MSRFGFTIAILFSLFGSACAKTESDVDFHEQVAAMSECRSVCASLANACGDAGNDCEARCVSAISPEQRTCLTAIDSCDEARSCTEDRTVAHVDTTSSATVVR